MLSREIYLNFSLPPFLLSDICDYSSNHKNMNQKITIMMINVRYNQYSTVQRNLLSACIYEINAKLE